MKTKNRIGKIMKLLIVAVLFCALNVQAKQAIICKKSESFDETLQKVNGMMIEPTWPIDIPYVRENGSKTTLSANPKNFTIDVANVQYFETKENIKEKKKTREVIMYNACIPVEFN
jgi:hypothetical protein